VVEGGFERPAGEPELVDDLAIAVEEVAMRVGVRAIIADDGLPLAGHARLVLDREIEDLPLVGLDPDPETVVRPEADQILGVPRLHRPSYKYGVSEPVVT
jgi:hypothetical protein